MATWQGKSRRKPTGGRRVFSAGKRKFEIGREKQLTRLGVQSLRQYRGAGGSVKVAVLSAEFANVANKETNVVERVKIKNVKVNQADPNYVQRNVLNKGATIETDLGDAVVTSRPGQNGVVNAILL
ncbi:MAG: 30S ribosomal protein S8e [archaeon]|nr:30S ribosomal protein S8e [archaeon]